MSRQPVIEICCIKHVYPDRTEVDLCGLDFVIEQGDRSVILGPNGSGKTTLLLHMMGLLAAVEGRISVFGMDPVQEFDAVKERFGVVFQAADEQLIAPTVIEDITFTPRSRGMDPAEIERRAGEVMELVGITALRDRLPHYLSGGEKKKVALAGALITDPELLILDEPFTGLDPHSRHEMIDIINGVNSRLGTTIVLTTHDVNLVPLLADTVHIIDRGDVVFAGKPLDAFKDAEILARANLEPPILIELIDALRRRGVEVEPTVSVEEAAESLYRLIK